jgi:ATP-dependent DNA helicase RecQ
MLDTNRIENLLRERFALSDFRRGQREILADVLERRDTLAVMPTGGGKSLCYQLPSVYHAGIVLVISPLISLMRDQVQALKARGIAAGSLHSDQTEEEKKRVFVEMKRSPSYLLYLSPERVQKPGFSAWFKSAPLTLVAIDEAHCVSQWGPDFRPDYYRLQMLRQLRPKVPILALTATATPQVLEDISVQLKLMAPARHVYGFYRPNIYSQVEACDDDNEKFLLLVNALNQTPTGRIIIYAGTRKRCESLCRQLKKEFDGVEFYHAGMTAEERVVVQNNFTNGETRILFATNAFGMGVDHPDIRLVVHFQMPGNIESYYQEMGRAGRDGMDSTCLLLYAKKDKGLQAYFITQSDAPKEVINQRWRALDTMVQFAEGGECRHAGILTYFKDTQRLEACGHCDVCDAGSHRKIVRSNLNSFLSRVVLRKGKEKSKKTPRDQTPLSELEQLRYEIIREWRHNYAKKRDMPPFIIFSNKTLFDIIKKDPKNPTAL